APPGDFREVGQHLSLDLGLGHGGRRRRCVPQVTFSTADAPLVAGRVSANTLSDPSEMTLWGGLLKPLIRFTKQRENLRKLAAAGAITAGQTDQRVMLAALRDLAL